MIDVNIVAKLKELGIYFEKENQNLISIKVYSHFNGNKGYYLVKDGVNEIVLLKAIHKDFIRVIKGKLTLKEKDLSKISDIMAQIDKNIDENFYAFFQVEEEIKIVSLDIDNNIKNSDFIIKKPLSNIEYNMFKDNFANEKSIYSRGLTAELFPDTLSTFATSILKRVPDILNPFFMHAGFKTFSPSIKILFNKLYANYTNLEFIYRTVKLDESFLHLCYAPHLFVKHKKSKLSIPNIKMLHIDNEEIDDFLKDIDLMIDEITFDDIAKDKFNELIAMITMCGTMIFFLMVNSFILVRKFSPSWSEALKIIYKTRSNSIFTLVNNKDFIESFDPFLKVKKVKFDQFDFKEKEELIKILPLKIKLFNKKNIIKLIDDCHYALGLRDQLYLKTNKLIIKVKNILKELGQEFVNDRKFNSIEDLKYFEINELNNIKEDNFFGNIPFTKHFKSSQTERFNYQIAPLEIFEKDIDNSYEIIDKQFEKASKVSEVDALSYFYVEDFEPNDCLIKRVVRFTDLQDRVEKQAIITENTSIFSFATEFAAINNIPLYTGVRFAPLIINDKKFILKENQIKLIDK